MKFPTKVLTLSLICMNMVAGLGPNKYNNIKKYGTNMGMTPKDIEKSTEYEKLFEACDELNNLLDNGVIENFIEIPSETATKVDNAIRNILELIFPKDNMYSSGYWIQKIIENPQDDTESLKIKRVLPKFLECTDSINRGTCDYWAPDILYSLAPYINGDKKSNIAARSVFAQMMLKLTTEKKLKKTALMMIVAAFLSKDSKADYFLTEYRVKKDLVSCHNIFEDNKLEDLVEKATNYYIYILKNYLN